MSTLCRLEWGSGNMLVDLDEFFPTTVSKTRQFVDLMRHDKNYRTNPGAITMILNYLESRIKNEKEEVKRAAINANLTKAALTEAKTSLGARRTSAEYRDARDKADEAIAAKRQHERNVAGLIRARDMLREMRNRL